jgi:hypothetical protein
VAVDVASADLLNKIVTDLGHLDGLEQLASGRNGGKQDTQESEAALP